MCSADLKSFRTLLLSSPFSNVDGPMLRGKPLLTLKSYASTSCCTNHSQLDVPCTTAYILQCNGKNNSLPFNMFTTYTICCSFCIIAYFVNSVQKFNIIFPKFPFFLNGLTTPRKSKPAYSKTFTNNFLIDWCTLIELLPDKNTNDQAPMTSLSLCEYVHIFLVHMYKFFLFRRTDSCTSCSHSNFLFPLFLLGSQKLCKLLPTMLMASYSGE